MMSKLVLILLLFFDIVSTSASPLNLLEDPLHAHYQLPRVVKVIGYELTLEPFFPFPGLGTERQDLTFEGTAIIHFQIIEPTPVVWLNYENLKIQSVVLKRFDFKEVVNEWSLDVDKAQVKVETVDWFVVGDNHTLEIKYIGPLYSTRDGGFFYYTYPFDGTTNKRTFPCFDDPYFKAWYQLNLIYPKNAKYFHTTMEEGQPKFYSPTKKIVSFKQTKPMSSYLFSVAVGDFDYSSAVTSRGIPTRSIVFSELKDYSTRTSQISADCIDAFETLVGYNFPLNKLDNIDTHRFFHGGGIENWGIILYTDVLAQLWDSLSAVDALGVKSIMCHETSHQWMGDLVTTKHWGNEFLHESFADYFSIRLMQHSEEDKDYVESDFIIERFYGFASSVVEGHPIATNESNFDGVTYNTGSSVLRMLEGVIGQDNFYKIVKTYLETFAFKNADMYDLIKIVGDNFQNVNLCGDLTYREFLLDFLTQPYYPVVDISIWNEKPTFTQRSINSTLDNKWNIPLFVFDSALNKQQIYWLLKNGSLCYPSSVKEPKTGLIYNYKAFSFAQIQYSSTYWNDLLELDYSKIDEHTILGLLIDLSLDAKLKTPLGANLVLGRFINKLLDDFNGLLSPQIIQHSLLALRKIDDARETIMNTTYPHINWDATQLREGALAELLLVDAVKSDIDGALNKASTLFTQFMTDCATLDQIETCNKLNSNIRQAVYCSATLNGDSAAKTFLNNYIVQLQQLVVPKFYLEQELNTAYRGVNCATKETLLERRLKKKGLRQNIPFKF